MFDDNFEELQNIIAEQREAELKENKNSDYFNIDENFSKSDIELLMKSGYDFNKLTLEEKEREEYNTKVKSLYSAFGEELTKFLNDDEIIEINLNQDGYLWVERFKKGRERIEEKPFSSMKGKIILELVADFNKTTLTRENPIISAVLPHGERISGIISTPVGYKPVFNIRKRSKIQFSLQYYVDTKVLTEEQKAYIEEKIEKKKNILIAGQTSSGKTTFGNACVKVLEELAEKSNDGYGDRVAIIEEVPELVCNIKNVLNLVVDQFTSAMKLLEICMRLTPDRIIFGELRRGIEVIELLKAWNSGHDGGITTIHSGGGVYALRKLEQYIGDIAGINIDTQKILIGDSIDVIIHLAKTKQFERKVKEITEVKRYDSDRKKYVVRTIFKSQEEFFDNEDDNEEGWEYIA